MALNKPINLDRIRKIRGGRVTKVGLELEGGWDREPLTRLGIKLEGDGSVKFEDPTKPIPHQKGELKSHPMPPVELENWVKIYYPQHINKTCGMHMHMSTKYALYYQMLMTVEYPSTIVKYMKEWAETNKLPPEHPIWDRLAGKSKYCQHIFTADDQVLTARRDFDQNAKGHRYTVINYCHKRLGTLECRLLPMMETADLAVSALNEILSITERFLVAQAVKEPKIREDIAFSRPGEEEHMFVEVAAGSDLNSVSLYV